MPNDDVLLPPSLATRIMQLLFAKFQLFSQVIQSLGCLIHGLIESRTTVDSLLQSLTKLLPTDGAGTSG